MRKIMLPIKGKYNIFITVPIKLVGQKHTHWTRLCAAALQQCPQPISLFERLLLRLLYLWR